MEGPVKLLDECATVTCSLLACRMNAYQSTAAVRLFYRFVWSLNDRRSLN